VVYIGIAADEDDIKLVPAAALGLLYVHGKKRHSTIPYMLETMVYIF
jgi:hypothetical protein